MLRDVDGAVCWLSVSRLSAGGGFCLGDRVRLSWGGGAVFRLSLVPFIVVGDNSSEFSWGCFWDVSCCLWIVLRCLGVVFSCLCVPTCGVLVPETQQLREKGWLTDWLAQWWTALWL